MERMSEFFKRHKLARVTYEVRTQLGVWYNPSPQAAEAGELPPVWGQPGLDGEFQVNHSYKVRSAQKDKK